MIGSCDICDRWRVPVRHFDAGESGMPCETYACFICQGSDDLDPYGEIEEIGNGPAKSYESYHATVANSSGVSDMTKDRKSKV